MNLVFSCENARIIGSENAKIIQYEPCCDCVPCRTIISTDYYGLGKYPENYKKNLMRKHIDYIYHEGYKVLNEKGENVYDIMYAGECPQIVDAYQLKLDFKFDDDYLEGTIKNYINDKQ